MKSYTPKQQRAISVKVKRNLIEAGWRECEDYVWIEAGINNKYCVKRDATSWLLQSAELGQIPSFGRSGTTSFSAHLNNAKETLHNIWTNFYERGNTYGYELATRKAKAKVAAAIPFLKSV